MSNRIIKDFKGWSLIHENKDPNPYPPGTKAWQDHEDDLTIHNAAEQDAIDKYNASVASQPPATTVVTAGTAGTAGTSAVTKAATPVAATPIVPTPDLTAPTVNPTALTRADWAAIQTKLNVANLDLKNILNKDVSANPNPLGLDIPQVKESRSFTKLYEEQLAPLVVDGLVGTKTLAAVADFVTKYNLKPENSTKQLPVETATATTINPQVLAAIAAAIAAPTTQLPTGPTGPAAAANSVFGPSANITEADFATQITKVKGYDRSSYSSEPTKLLLATAKQFKTATAGPGTNEANMIASIKVCKSASDFYKLNAVISNTMSGDIAYIINDELESDNLAEVQAIKAALDAIQVTAAFLEEDKKDASAKVIGKQFKIKSFTITIPKGSEPATVFSKEVYTVASNQSKQSTGSADILYA